VDCNCPFDCDETVYLPEISQAALNPNASIFNKAAKTLDAKVSVIRLL
jgi:hypothetical protein